MSWNSSVAGATCAGSSYSDLPPDQISIRLSSDLDFLVTFEDLDPNRYRDTYFGLLQDLQKLF